MSIGIVTQEITNKKQDFIIPVILALLTVLSRLPFMSDRAYLVDALGFCRGAMTTLISHGAGYIGYCLLGRLAYYLTHDVNLGLVLVNIMATGLATALLYQLGKEMFGKAQGLFAAIFYATSIDTFYCSEVALTYAVEGFIVVLFVLFAARALAQKSMSSFYWATAVFAICGAVRITTLGFLTPLWLYTACRSVRKPLPAITAIAIFAAIFFSWSIPQARILKRVVGKDTISTLYSYQGAVTLAYDRAALPGEATHADHTARFLWPGLEIAVALFNHVSPPTPSAPPGVASASLKHGLAHFRTQFLKLIFYTLMAGGLASICWLLPVISAPVRKSFRQNSASSAILAIWILPAFVFFALGHFGPWGFLLFYLGGLCLLAAQSLVVFVSSGLSLVNAASPEGEPDSSSPAAATRSMPAKTLKSCYAFVCISAILNIAFFVFCRPLPETSERNKLLNLLVLQYTAPAIRQHFARARSGLAYKDQ